MTRMISSRARSVAEIRGIATCALAGRDDYSRELLRELEDEKQRH
jgi:hypothetical protein